MKVYRVQPAGLGIRKHRTESSNGELVKGCHVFCSLPELVGAVPGWCECPWTPEIVTIRCSNKNVVGNHDYEGDLLLRSKGKIVARRKFKNWRKQVNWCKRKSLELSTGKRS